ncbi:MAG: hypothetical protein ACK4M5_05535, partial [Dietzia cercidiphylli]
ARRSTASVDAGKRGSIRCTVEDTMDPSRVARGPAGGWELPGRGKSLEPMAPTDPRTDVTGIGAPSWVDAAMLSDGAPNRLPGATLGTREPGSTEPGSML